MYKNFVKSTFPLFNLEKQNVSENERIILKTASIAFCFFPLLFSSLVFCFLFFYFFIVFCCSSFFHSLKGKFSDFPCDLEQFIYYFSRSQLICVSFILMFKKK